MSIEYLYLNAFEIYACDNVSCLLHHNQHIIEAILRKYPFEGARKHSIQQGIYIYAHNGFPLYNSYLREYMHDYNKTPAKLNLLYSREEQFHTSRASIKSRKIYLVNQCPGFYFHTIELLANICNVDQNYSYWNSNMLKDRVPILFMGRDDEDHMKRHVIANIL